MNAISDEQLPGGAEEHYRGLGLSGGVALSRVCLFNDRRHADLPDYRVEGKGKEREKERFGRAVAKASERLEVIRGDVERRVGRAEAEIFSAQRMILEDEALRTRVHETVERDGVNAERAVSEVLDAYESRLQDVDNEYLKERASDIGEIRRRLLDVLRDTEPGLRCAGQPHCRKGGDRIVIAEELTPSLSVDLDVDHTRGFVTERGGRHSHAAILARSLGIPAVSGVPGLHARVPCGTEVLIDGDAGEVYVRPSPETVSKFQPVLSESRPRIPVVPPVPGWRVLANLSGLRDREEAVRLQAEGVGLYRTEMEHIAVGRLLDEEEQYQIYAGVVDSFRDKPVTFRLLDAGGDKPLPGLETYREENPVLGLRGARFLLQHGDLLRTQARALVRAARHGPLRVLYPMIVDLAQYRALRALFESAAGSGAGIRHGVMFEVPSACLQAKALLAECDFASIGSNDLVQYLFAIDRNNERVAPDYVPDHPIFWDLLKRLASAARSLSKPISVCGELAGDPDSLPRLWALGFREVSVSPRLIPRVRLAAQAMDSHSEL